jgi:hypothetical protein
MANKKDEPKDTPVETVETPKTYGESVGEPAAREVKVEVVLHDARYIDVRTGREIRRIKDKALAAQHNKLGEFIHLDAGIWEKADYAPYAKPKKK